MARKKGVNCNFSTPHRASRNRPHFRCIQFALGKKANSYAVFNILMALSSDLSFLGKVFFAFFGGRFKKVLEARFG